MEPSKEDIERGLEGKGDFVRLDRIDNFLKQTKSLDIRKFLLAKQAEIYEAKGMLAEAARIHDALAHLSLTLSDKTNQHMKETELYVRGSMLEQADLAMKKAMTEMDERQKESVRKSVIDLYLKQGSEFERSQRRAQAMKLYEKMLTMHYASAGDKETANKRLLNLYEQTGKVREFFNLKGKIGN
jgi:hypothetical protein